MLDCDLDILFKSAVLGRQSPQSTQHMTMEARFGQRGHANPRDGAPKQLVFHLTIPVAAVF
jgi:hypothetical protein